MVFWRKKNNAPTERAGDTAGDREDALLHHPGEPALEPPVEYDAGIDGNLAHELAETELEILEELEEIPAPSHDVFAEPARRPEEETAGGGWLARLSRGLSRSSSKLGQGISDLLTKRRLDDDLLEEIEDLLITADLGPKAASRIAADLRVSRFGSDLSDDELKQQLAVSIAHILEPVAKPLSLAKPEGGGPLVVLVCGVNGVGKTTTIGKLAWRFHHKEGRKVMLAAADTFRAAAVEQLEIWSQRAKSPLVKKDVGADAAAVAFEAYERARRENVDVLLIDTAGRLHNKANLMAELEKVIRVLKKQNPALPHETWLVLDATTGQNAHAQVKVFQDMTSVSGLVVTKLDGSAKGGVVVSLAEQFGLPVYAVGVGETAEDLQPFNAADFARSLVGLTD